MIDEKGRCCGRKPTEYKRENKLHCFRCNRDYDPATHEQIPNSWWKPTSEGFVEDFDFAAPVPLNPRRPAAGN
jgi:hypothetical protein